MFSERIVPASEEMPEEELDECCYLMNQLGFSTGETARCAFWIKRLLEEVARLREKKGDESLASHPPASREPQRH